MVSVENPFYECVEWGTSIETFIERVQKHNSIIYFHNLKFDAMFIIYWLLVNDYKWTDERHIDEKHFKSLISDMGKFYSVTVKWENGHTTEFRDSVKKLPMTLRRIAESFNLETTKGSIDYDSFRPVGHKLTEEELDYLKRDVAILGQAMKEVLESGMTKLTVASDAMNEFKTLSEISYFNKLFPVLNDVMDAEIRKAYRGGFTYCDDRFKGRVLGSGLVLDVNSLYPFIMKTTMLPYGFPEFVRGKVEPNEHRPLTVFSVTFTAKLKKNHTPCIQIKGSNMFIGTEYLRTIDEPTTLTVTNVDWELYNKHYDIEVLSYNDGWRFKAMRGMFDKYIDKWSKVKESAVGGKREIAKLHLNSLYGKFASNPNVTGKYPVLVDGVIKLKRGKDETRDPVYTAVGVFITAHARTLTITAAQDNYDAFAYADTDSLHLLTDEIPESLEIHKTKLGAWKHEYNFCNAYYIRPKAYLEKKQEENLHDDECDKSCEIMHNYENRIAGLPVDISSRLTFADLVPGKILHGKLNPKSVPGGVVLKNVPFELKLH